MKNNVFEKGDKIRLISNPESIIGRFNKMSHTDFIGKDYVVTQEMLDKGYVSIKDSIDMPFYAFELSPKHSLSIIISKGRIFGEYNTFSESKTFDEAAIFAAKGLLEIPEDSPTTEITFEYSDKEVSAIVEPDGTKLAQNVATFIQKHQKSMLTTFTMFFEPLKELKEWTV